MYLRLLRIVKVLLVGVVFPATLWGIALLMQWVASLLSGMAFNFGPATQWLCLGTVVTVLLLMAWFWVMDEVDLSGLWWVVFWGGLCVVVSVSPLIASAIFLGTVVVGGGLQVAYGIATLLVSIASWYVLVMPLPRRVPSAKSARKK